MISPNFISVGLLLCTLSAAAISMRIFRVRGGKNALPGCGGKDSGCDAVLHSRWARWGPWSVAALSATTYTILTLVASMTFSGAPAAVREIAWRVLVAMTPAIAGASIWFLSLQILVLRRFCLYCSFIHLFGIGVVCLIGISQNEAHTNGSTHALWESLANLSPGITGLALLIGGQLMWSPRMYRITASPDNVAQPLDSKIQTSSQVDASANSKPPSAICDSTFRRQSAREVSVYGGKIKLEIDRWPLLGSPDAEDVFVYFFDYTCDTCRHLHSLLTSLVQRNLGRWGILLIPIPAESFCNPHVTCRFAVHAHACAYARLGLAVWKANPDLYEAFDKFLFEGERPPPVFAAHAEANRLIGKKLYDPEITDVDFDPLIQSGIKMFHSLGLERTPVLLLRNGKLQGHVSTAQDLAEIFWKDSKVQESSRGAIRVR